MKIPFQPFGITRNGHQVYMYTLHNSSGTEMKVLNMGGIIYSLEFRDRAGTLDNVSCNLETLEEYEVHRPFFGALVGRFGNRISGGGFEIDELNYKLALNHPPDNPVCSLHGGNKGFDTVIWEVEPYENLGSEGLMLTYISPDGEEGYPGNLKTTVCYELNDSNELIMEYTATTDKKTFINLTNHTHWNLGGARSGSILEHVLTLNADAYLSTDRHLIPTGDLVNVGDTPFDFRCPKKVGRDIAQIKESQFNGGYDHCYILNQRSPGELTLCAKLSDPKSGRTMEIWTTEPAVQFYSGNFLDGSLQAFEHGYEKYNALCLETQHYPDSPHRSNFPSALLEPDQTYHHLTIHKLSSG